MIQQFRKMRDQKGAALVEYVLIAALIAVVVVGILGTVGRAAQTKLNTVATSLR